MRRRAEVAGLPVVVVDSGKSVGRVKDALFDLSQGRLRGLLVASGGRDYLLPFDQVHSLGTAAVTIGAESVMHPAGGGVSGETPMGKRVLTREGRVLGIIDDVVFDPESGAVWGYQLSGGFIADFVDGKKSVPLTEDLVVGPDSVIVADAGDISDMVSDQDSGGVIG